MRVVTIITLALFMVSAVFATGYIVALVQIEPRPVETGLPACTDWGFMQPTPHKPGDELKCKLRRPGT